MSKAAKLAPQPGWRDLPSGGKYRRDPANPGYGWVACPDCPKVRYVRVPSDGSKNLPKFTGRDQSCENKHRDWGERPTKYEYPTVDQRLGEDGSEAFWSQRKGMWVPVKCGACEITRDMLACIVMRPGSTGLHRGCIGLARRRPNSGMYPAFTGTLPLPQGTKALLSDRLPGNRHKIGIECRGCFKETGQVKYVLDKQIISYVRWLHGVYALTLWHQAGETTVWLWPYLKRFFYLKRMFYWDELCSDCCRERGSLDRLTTDQTAESGTVTRFSKVDENGMVEVAYINPEFRCGCVRPVKREDAVTHWRKFPIVCRECHNDPIKYHLKLAAASKIEATSGNGGEQNQITSTENGSKNTWGGERNKYWTDERSDQLLTQYDGMLLRIKDKDPNLPEEVKAKLKERGNKPSDVALEHIAQQFEHRSLDYLRQTILPKARKARRQRGS